MKIQIFRIYVFPNWSLGVSDSFSVDWIMIEQMDASTEAKLEVVNDILQRMPQESGNFMTTLF